MADWKKSPKSMNLDQLKSYKKELEAGGHTGKEYGKVINLIKTLQPEKYDTKTVANAYKGLSSGVTKQGGWTEEHAEDIYKYTGSYPTFTQDAQGNQLSSYLNGYQESVFGSSGSPEVRSNLINKLEPAGGMPELVDWSEMHEELLGDYGVVGLEDTLNTLTSQREEEMAITEERVLDIEGKPYGNMGVISGRIGEVERQQQRRIDFINRQINTVTNQLNSAYNIIGQIMQFERMEYEDAVQDYQIRFNQNLKIYELISAEMDKQQQLARANLQTYQNLLVDGNISWNNLNPDQKAFVHKLEVQSGFPVGFLSNIKGKLVGVGTGGGEIIIKDDEGHLTLEEMPIFTPTSGIGTKSKGGEWTYTGVTDTNKLGWSPTEKQTTQSNIQLTKSQVASAVQKVIKLGGNQSDVNRVQSDYNFALWVLAQD